MIKHPERERSDIIKETLYNITNIQNRRIACARSQTEIDAAYQFAADATAELQRYFTRPLIELDTIAEKYRHETE